MAKGSGTTRTVGSSSASAPRTTASGGGRIESVVINGRRTVAFESNERGNRAVTSEEYNSLSREAKADVQFARGMGDGTLNSAIRAAKINALMTQESIEKLSARSSSEGLRDTAIVVGDRRSGYTSLKDLKETYEQQIKVIRELEKLRK